ncbi:MAG: RnfABCDGE type electron transport complex subunit G [Lentisphaeria bacterium]|nr:RnfABCDGE type electron transport complex subunit G [Lentisphaeria bacterium]
MTKLRENESVPVLGAFLGITALVSALVLSPVFMLTRAPIEKMQRETMQKSLKMLNLPLFDNAPDREAKEYISPGNFKVVIMPVRKAGALKAFAVRSVSPDGYAGDVEITAGFDLAGKILAVLVTRQQETPGLGSNVCERKFRKTIFNLFQPRPVGLPPNHILDQFHGKTVPEKESWKVKRDGGSFDFVTGATITSRAVTAAVEQAGKTLRLHMEDFMKGEKK